MSGKDAARDERILMEAVVDAYGPEERAMGWYYYLDEKISFPFAAECAATDKRNPLELNERVTVMRMAGEENCEHDMYVDVSWGGKVLAAPLAQLSSLDADDDSLEAVDDWHYWVMQGYLF